MKPLQPSNRRTQKGINLPTISEDRFPTILDNAVTSFGSPLKRIDYINQMKVDIHSERRDRHNTTARSVEIKIDVVVTHARSKVLRTRFESSSIYANALITLLGRAFVFLSKVLKKESNTLAETFPELWNE